MSSKVLDRGGLDPSALDHGEASLLLPWLGTDRLAQPELERLLDHLKVCALCRAELRDLGDLGRFAELAEREEAPDASAIERRLAGVLGKLEARPSSRSERPARHPAAWGWRRALPLAALLVVAGGLLFLRGDGGEAATPGGPAEYKTLSDPAPAAPEAGPALRVVVADACSQAELRRWLLAADAEIRGGPSRLGVYTIALPAGAGPAAVDGTIAAWRGLPCFSFVEKAVASGAGP